MTEREHALDAHEESRKLEEALSILQKRDGEEVGEFIAELVSLLTDARARTQRNPPVEYDMQTWFAGDSRWVVANEVLHDAMLHLIASGDDKATRGAVAMLEVASRRRATMS